MKGYLIDVNHVLAHFEKNASFMSKVRAVPVSDLVRLSAITFGEIYAGHEMSKTTNIQRREEFTSFVINEYLHLVVDITASTHYHYGSIIGRIWRKHNPNNRCIETDAHLVKLGVDVNDVWLVASALEHGLIVLTHDSMACIREVVPEAQFECWI